MSKTKLHELAEYGQSLWLDFISRPLLETGALKDLVDQGLRGLTSNPSIFNQAISRSQDYDADILRLKSAGKTTLGIYDILTIGDIQKACDILSPVYKATKGLDGYVSLEINPLLAHNTSESISEGKRLYAAVNRPNVMIKVPATPSGFPVIESLLGQGINVNVTLIFSLQQYEKTAQAFIKGLEAFEKSGGNLSTVASVASVFVSRIDQTVDDLLDKKISASIKQEELSSLKGKAAVANCQLVYAKSVEIFNSAGFKTLVKRGASLQRVLWASTSVKNPNYPDIKYITELIAPNTVNTLPEKTLRAFMDHGISQIAMVGQETKTAQEILTQLQNNGIDINDICQQLLTDGVTAFEKSFSELTKAIEDKAALLTGQPG